MHILYIDILQHLLQPTASHSITPQHIATYWSTHTHILLYKVTIHGSLEKFHLEDHDAPRNSLLHV